MSFEDKNSHVKPFIIGITGGSSSGKTTLTKKICEIINEDITQFSYDNFYLGLPDNTNPNDYDFDNPNSFDNDMVYECAKKLSLGMECQTPVYCFKTHSRIQGKFETLKPNKIIIFEGIHSFYDKRIRDLYNLKIFIHCDADIALGRRVLRDIKERGRDVNEVLKRYNRFVKIDFEKYIQPLMKYSDLIIPSGVNNDIAMNFILDNLRNNLLDKKSKNNLILKSKKSGFNKKIKFPKNNFNYIKSIYNLIRGAKTQDLDFIFLKPFLKEIIVYLKSKIIKIYKNDNIFSIDNKEKLILKSGISLSVDKRLNFIITSYLDTHELELLKETSLKKTKIPVFIVSFVADYDIALKIVELNPLITVVNVSDKNIKSGKIIEFLKNNSDLKGKIESYLFSKI